MDKETEAAVSEEGRRESPSLEDRMKALEIENRQLKAISHTRRDLQMLSGDTENKMERDPGKERRCPEREGTNGTIQVTESVIRQEEMTISREGIFLGKTTHTWSTS